MNQVPPGEIRWNDGALLLRSGLIGLFLFCVLLAMGEHAKPPEGYVFERLPSVSGVYQCCGSGGRTSWSRVGTTPAICKRLEYFPVVGGGWFDCGYKNELNGHIVEVDRIIVPRLLSGNIDAVVIKLSSSGKTYFEYSDRNIRELWIDSMHSGALLIASIFMIVFHAIQLIYFSSNFKKPREQNP
jgi:hypothetical protein